MRPPKTPRVLVTRSPHQASELGVRLAALGCEPVFIPTVELVEPVSFAALDAALAELERFHWLLFTSANAVSAFHRRFELARHAGRVGARIAAIGSSTARALESTGLKAELVPPRAVAESFAEVLLPYARQEDGSLTRFLLVRAEEAREYLPETLRAAGAEVVVAAAYRTVVPKASIPAVRALFQAESGLDAMTFTSSSSVRNMLALCEAAGVSLPDGPLRVSIGPITSQALRDAGYPPHAESVEATVAALAEAVMRALRESGE